MANIIFAYADSEQEWNTSMHRCIIPARILSGRGHKCSLSPIPTLFGEPKPEVQAVVDAADIIVLERLLVEDIHHNILKWREQGKRVYATFDDAYHLLPKSGGIPALTWRGGKSHKVGTNSDGSERFGSILNQFREGLRLVDGALVPSKVLMDDYWMYCENMQFVPNILHPNLWQDLKPRAPDNNFIIIWGGSSAHDISWRDSGLPQALGSICKKYPRVNLHIRSLDPKILILLDKANLQGRYTAHGWTTFEAWPKVVKMADLYAIPLAGEYDRRRSSLKCLESAMANIPWVASDLEPYHEARGGILVENRSAAWVKAISSLINSREERERLAQEGRMWAESLWAGAGDLYETSLGIKKNEQPSQLQPTTTL